MVVRAWAGLDPDTGLIVPKGKWKKRIARVVKKLEDAIEKVKKGEFVPDREDDELTLALGNPEHWERCRGRGAGVKWNQGFPADVATYRSSSRNKKRGLDRLSELERQVKQLIDRQLDSITQQRASQLLIEDPAVHACPSQLKSSVVST